MMSTNMHVGNCTLTKLPVPLALTEKSVPVGGALREQTFGTSGFATVIYEDVCHNCGRLHCIRNPTAVPVKAGLS